MATVPKALCLAVAACALLAAGCGTPAPQVAVRDGGGSEVVGLSGSAVDSAGRPLAAVPVRLRRGDYLPSAALFKEAPGPGDSRIYSADTRTDDSGRFLIANVDTGAYLIEIADSAAGLGAVLACTVSVGDSLLLLPPATVKPTVVLRGRIPLHYHMDSTRVRVVVFGTEHAVVTGPGGDFEIRGMAEGRYTLRFIASSAEYLPLDTSGIWITDGEPTEIGPVFMWMRGPGVVPADSAALRAILDANGLHFVQIQQVADIDPASRRIVGLRLQNLMIRTLTPRLGELTGLRSLRADYDSISSLPEGIGQLGQLRLLSLRANHLSALPEAIGQLDSLEELVVADNWLADLPPQIGQLKRLTFLDASANRLAGLPPEIGECESLKYLALAGNRIQSLPETFSGLDQLIAVSLQFNRLASLPQSLVTLTSDRLRVDVTANRLCAALPRDLETWIDAHSRTRGWLDGQLCD